MLSLLYIHNLMLHIKTHHVSLSKLEVKNQVYFMVRAVIIDLIMVENII